MMNCQHVANVADDFHERRLGWRDRLAVLAHVAMCKGCREFLEQFRLSLIGLRALPAPAPVPAAERLLEGFRLELGTPERMTRMPTGGHSQFG